MLWAGEAAPISGSELRPVLEILCTLGQGRGDRECRECLPRGAPSSCRFAVAWSAMVVVRSVVSHMLWCAILDA